MTFLQLLASGVLYVYKRFANTISGIRDLSGILTRSFPQLTPAQSRESARILAASALAAQAQEALPEGQAISPGLVPQIPDFPIPYRYVVTIVFEDLESGERVYRSFPIDSNDTMREDEIRREVERIVDRIYREGIGSPKMGEVINKEYVSYDLNHIFRGA